MFRPRRSARRLRSILNPAQLQALQRANQLSSSGQFAQAAPLYAGLAQEMDAASHPRLAANLHAQAAHAYADSQAETQALAEARLAMDRFLQYQMVGRAPRFFANITNKLNLKGLKAAARTIQNEYGDRVSALPTPGQVQPAPRGRLPGSCPQCGAPLRRDELTWSDRFTTECPFCGSIIQTQA